MLVIAINNIISCARLNPFSTLVSDKLLLSKEPKKPPATAPINILGSMEKLKIPKPLEVATVAIFEIWANSIVTKEPTVASFISKENR